MNYQSFVITLKVIDAEKISDLIFLLSVSWLCFTQLYSFTNARDYEIIERLNCYNKMILVCTVTMTTVVVQICKTHLFM